MPRFGRKSLEAQARIREMVPRLTRAELEQTAYELLVRADEMADEVKSGHVGVSSTERAGRKHFFVYARRSHSEEKAS
jgi:hypothetical protein